MIASVKHTLRYLKSVITHTHNSAITRPVFHWRGYEDLGKLYNIRRHRCNESLLEPNHTGSLGHTKRNKVVITDSLEFIRTHSVYIYIYIMVCFKRTSADLFLFKQVLNWANYILEIGYITI